MIDVRSEKLDNGYGGFATSRCYRAWILDRINYKCWMLNSKM